MAPLANRRRQQPFLIDLTGKPKKENESSTDSEGEGELIGFNSHSLAKSPTPDQVGADVDRAAWEQLDLTACIRSFLFNTRKLKGMILLVHQQYTNFKMTTKSDVPTPPIEELEKHLKFVFNKNMVALMRRHTTENDANRFF